jgi:hypothetical protein
MARIATSNIYNQVLITELTKICIACPSATFYCLDGVLLAKKHQKEKQCSPKAIPTK